MVLVSRSSQRETEPNKTKPKQIRLSIRLMSDCPALQQGCGEFNGRGRGVPDHPVEGVIEGVVFPVRFLGVQPAGVCVGAALIDLPGKRDAVARKKSLAQRMLAQTRNTSPTAYSRIDIEDRHYCCISPFYAKGKTENRIARLPASYCGMQRAFIVCTQIVVLTRVPRSTIPRQSIHCIVLYPTVLL